MSSSVTPSSAAHAGSMSRGTARSTSSSGRRSRASITASSSSAPMIACGEAVEETTTSARSSSPGSASKEPEAPPKRCASAIARSRRRLATNIVVTPWAWNARAVCSDVSPAPTITTWRAASSPTAARAASTATVATDAWPGGDRRLRAHALAGRQRGAEELVGQRAGGARGERPLVGALDLALDLGLADDHRLQAADDAVQVARRVAVAVRRRSPSARRRVRRGARASQHARLGLAASPPTT